MLRHYSRVCLTGAGLLGLMMLPVLALADARTEEFIKSRQANTRDLGGGYNEIRQELRKSKPMQFLIEQYAAQMESLAQDQARWFPPGTGPDSGYLTQAKANIWTDQEEFQALYAASLAATSKLNQVAGAKDYKALEDQLKVVKDACLACHDKFKTKGEHDLQF